MPLDGWPFEMDAKEILYNFNEEEYGPDYKSHFVEMYKTYLEMTDRISSRRQSANNYFLSINTALVGLIGYLQLGIKNCSDYYFLIALAGMILCFIWYRLIKSYKGLNSGKFKIIHLIEKELPISPYDAEWEIVGRGKNHALYHPFTHVEMSVPWVFFSLHFFVLATSCPWNDFILKFVQ